MTVVVACRRLAVVVGCCRLSVVDGCCRLLTIYGCCRLLTVVGCCRLLTIDGCCRLLTIDGRCRLLTVDCCCQLLTIDGCCRLSTTIDGCCRLSTIDGRCRSLTADGCCRLLTVDGCCRLSTDPATAPPRLSKGLTASPLLTPFHTCPQACSCGTHRRRNHPRGGAFEGVFGGRAQTRGVRFGTPADNVPCCCFLVGSGWLLYASWHAASLQPVSGAHILGHSILRVERFIWEEGGLPNLSTSNFSPFKIFRSPSKC